MKKISILALHLGYGGIEKSIVALANLLCDRYNVEIVSSYKLYDRPVFDLDKRVSVRYLLGDLKPNRQEFMKALKSKKIITAFSEGIKSLKILRLRKKTMIEFIKRSDSDVIISTRDIFNTWLGDYANENVLKIGWEHNHFHGNDKYATNVINSCKNLDYLVVVSNDLQKYYSHKLDGKKCMCVYIPNSVDRVPKNTSSLEEKRLVSVGRLSKEKGFIDLLKVYKKVLKTNPDWVLDIIGDGVERKSLEEYISKNNLDGKVTLHGFQGKDYIDKVLHKSSIYVMTSFTESFGIVLIEAMSHGIPCIAFSSAEGAREIINSGENGYLIKNRNHSAMIKKINDLINDYDERVRLGKSARRGIKNFTSDVVKEEWITLIEESDINE